MNHEQIEELIVLDLAGEATDEQSQRLAELVESDPGVAALYLEILEADQTVAEYLSPSSAEEIPRVPHESLLSSMRASEPAAEPASNLVLFPFVRVIAVAAAAIALGLFLLPKMFSPDGDAEIEGYYVHSGGTTILRRGGQEVPISTSMALRTGDRIELASGSSGFILSAEGQKSISGPLETSLADAKIGKLAELENSTMGTALAGSLDSLATLISDEPMPEIKQVEIHSPIEDSFSLRPIFSWFATAGESYNVIVTDASTGEEVISLKAVRPPVASPEKLLAQGNYRIEVAGITGGTAQGTASFRTPTAGNAIELPGLDSEPGERLAFATRLLAEHGRAGASDALGVVKTLPADYAADELSLRLKLYSYHELALDHRCRAMLEKLRKLAKEK